MGLEATNEPGGRSQWAIFRIFCKWPTDSVPPVHISLTQFLQSSSERASYWGTVTLAV